MSTKDRVFSRLFDKRQHGLELKKAEAKLRLLELSKNSARTSRRARL